MQKDSRGTEDKVILTKKQKKKISLLACKSSKDMYLNAYYALKPTRCFGNTALHFPSHKEIYACMVKKTGMPFGTPLENMMIACGYPTDALALERHRKNKKHHSLAKPKTVKYYNTDNTFYASDEWRALRYKALELNGGACQCCGRTRKHGVVLHVDHIKPRSLYPELQLALDNLQILCEDCNLGKSNKFATDWR